MLLELISSGSTADMYSAAIVVLSTALVYYFIIYPLYFHPLSDVPGPLICKLTRYWILFKSWNEERNRYVQALHEKYGTIVRIGPDQVDINDVAYLKDIYVGNFDKTGFYAQFVNYDSHCTFSTTDKGTHKESRKVSHKFYSKTNICSPTIMPRIERVIHDTLEVLHEKVNQPVNAFVLFCDMAMDAVSAFSFGNNYDSLLVDPFGKGERVVTDFGLQSSTGFWVTEMPQWYDWVVSKPVSKASQRCYDWIERQFNTAYDQLGKSISDGVESLLTVYFDFDFSNNKPIQKSKLFDKRRTKSEFFDHIAAGHVTTATTMSYFFYEMASKLEIQNRLREELLDVLNHGIPISSEDPEPISYSAVDDEAKLPFMHACMYENFRIHAGIPGQEPRLVPTKGLIFRGSGKVPVVKLPGGTVVTMQPWSLHRVHSTFPDPEKYDPQRWMDADKAQLKTMKGHLMHFGSGARMCIGQHLATAEIKMSMANIMCRYRVELVDDFDYEKDGAMMDIYTTVPRSEKMMLRFIPLKSL